MPRSLHRALQRRAETEGVSLNQFVVSTLARAVGDERAESGAPDAPGGEQLYRLADQVAELGQTTVALQAAGAQRGQQVDDRLASLADALDDLSLRAGDHERALAAVEQQVADLEDEWYVREEGTFTRSLTTGSVLVDPDEKARRARLRERAAPRFRRVHG